LTNASKSFGTNLISFLEISSIEIGRRNVEIELVGCVEGFMMASELPKSAKEPLVGIFFYANSSLHIESTPLSQAERRGEDFLLHAGDLKYYWENTLAPSIPGHRDKSYDFFPRGRVVYSIKDGKFLLYHDICIPQTQITGVMAIMNLPEPPDTVIDLDVHYRCASCNGNYVSDSIWEEG